MDTNSYVIIGASSEIGNQVINKLVDNDCSVMLVSRKFQSKFKQLPQLIVNNYLDELNNIILEINKFDDCIIFFFNGALFENRPTKFPTKAEIIKTEDVNYKIPAMMSQEINFKCKNVKKFVYLSSIAAVKQRYKNYIYGLNKNKLEKFVKNNISKKYLIFRFGLVFTNMSEGHKVPPFSLTASEASDIILEKINKTGIVYPNFKLNTIALILKILPKKIINLFRL